jgi:hypothetical protein
MCNVGISRHNVLGSRSTGHLRVKPSQIRQALASSQATAVAVSAKTSSLHTRAARIEQLVHAFSMNSTEDIAVRIPPHEQRVQQFAGVLRFGGWAT